MSIIINTIYKLMNILKILAILAIFVPSVVFAQTAVRSTSSSDVSAVGVRVETTGVESPDFGVTASEPETAGIEHEDIGITGDGDDGDAGNAEEIEFTLKPDRIEGKADDNVFCTEDARICPDGTGVGRVPPSCEFAKCPGEINDNDKKGRLDDDSDNDGLEDIDEDNRSSVDSFFDVFVDFSDEGTQEAVDAFFLELGDIKGESEVKSIENGDEPGDIKSGDEEGSATSVSKSKKPKEIVIVGSKVKEVIKSGDVQVRGWDPEKKEVTIDPEDVEEAKDLLDFIGATVVSDENIEKVAISPERIELEYAQPAKLFGFIPMSLTAKVVLSKKDKLKVKFPWYAFLTSDNVKEVKKDIDVLSLAWGAVASIGDTEMQDKALKFQTISNLLRASHDTASNSIRNMK